jgi:hypothetical protein
MLEMFSMLVALYLLGAVIFYVKMVTGAAYVQDEATEAEIIELFPEQPVKKAA